MAGNHTDTQKLTPLDKLKNFLNELFQFESQDLDFGVYKILGYKQNEVKKFIDELLVDKVKEQLDTLTSQEIRETQEELKELEASSTIQNWLKAKEADDTQKIKIYEEDFSDDIKNYKNLQRKLENTRVSVDTENQIYNHLTLFFSRYYDKGDFISKRRFGKKEKYVVPYNGEETHFYWANHDQYYIKSSEHFQHFAFKVPHAYGTLEVEFKLTEAQTPQGNEKQNEDTYFVLSETEPEWDGDKLTIYFEFRPLSDEEKQEVRKNGKQQSLDEIAAQALYENLGQEVKTQKLWETDDNEQTLLLRKLRHFTRKNSYDFFIHKDLKGFLQRELDFYIKSEMVEVDDLYVTEAEFHFDRVKQNFKKIKVFKEIADTIIEFLAQIENFQKKLWEKKKFVLRTDWVITLDRLVEYVGEETAKPLMQEIIQNEDQVAEWRDLFGEENVPSGPIKVDKLKADLHTWRKYPIDSGYFDEAFQERLLNVLSEYIELEDKSDGLVLHSDNYHAIQNMKKKYRDKISCIYIDPPYNTEKDREKGKFLYKDGFARSSWLSLIKQSLESSIDFLGDEGVFYSSIDDNENYRLKEIANELFGQQNNLAQLIWNLGTGTKAGHFTRYHEYILTYAKNKKILPNFDTKEENIIKHGALKRISSVNPASKIVFKAGTIKCEVDNIVFAGTLGNSEKQIIHGEMEFENGVLKNDVTVEAGWAMKNQLEKWLKGGEDVYDSKGQKIKRFYFNKNGILFYEKYKSKDNPPTVLTNCGNTKKGTKELNSLFWEQNFSFPKPTKLLNYLFGLVCKEKDIVFDFFAGTGTTFHSVQILNAGFGKYQKVKCILIEQSSYVYSVILPRLKKIAYSYDWNEGKPKNGTMNGLGVFFKYQRLEQYEESLENIEFTLPEEAQQQALEFEEYVPKYMLDFETRNSPALVNTETMQNPWAYKLKIWDGYTYDTQQAVDLVETFNYLIGLHVQKQITKAFSERKYQFIQGYTNDQQNVLVVWRSVQGWQQADYEADREILQQELPKYDYDQLYLNDQAHLEGYQPIEHVFTNQMLP